jgi:integrase
MIGRSLNHTIKERKKMKGTILTHQPKKGRKTFGYSLFLGRDETGKQLRQVRRGFAREKDAHDALHKAIEEWEHTPAAERIMPTFAEFFTRWHADKQRHTAPKTAERYGELGQYAVKLFGSTPLDRLDPMSLTASVHQLLDHGGQATRQHPKGKPLAAKTVRHIAFLVQDCLEQAVDFELISKNPMRKVKKPKVPRRRPRIVDRTGFDRLLRETEDRRLYPFVLTAASTGMRRGELCALEWTDLNWDTGILEVSKSLEETKAGGLRVKSTKSGEARRFAIPAEVVEALREHQRDQERDRALYGADYANLGLIFARPDGQYYNPDKQGRRVREAMRRAGLAGVTLHSLRHSHASELLSQGAPITAVSERLGHASPNITLSIYSHALPADNQAAAKLWNDSMSAIIEESRRRRKNGGLLLVITEPAGESVTHLKSAS